MLEYVKAMWLEHARATARDFEGNEHMAPANDIKAAKATYEGFINMIKVSTPIIALIVAFVVLIIQ